MDSAILSTINPVSGGLAELLDVYEISQDYVALYCICGCGLVCPCLRSIVKEGLVLLMYVGVAQLVMQYQDD